MSNQSGCTYMLVKGGKDEHKFKIRGSRIGESE